VVLSAGRLVKKKGHATLLRAAALLQERRVDYRLRIAGEGPEWATLQRLVHRLGIAEKVTFLGPLTESELETEYREADVFALACEELESGDRDGIPNVILEAMANTLPVVSTHCGGVGEAVVDGRCGLLVPQRDPPALASALGRLLDDEQLRVSLGRRGRDRVVAQFDRSRHLSRAVEALRSARLLPHARADRRDEPRPLSLVA
jgi:glycosyltransferase involved in cell wall biosynthesis